ncbi:MAG: hypothetical protein LBL13_04155 [Bacteroidales bacterium]|nr:hypothetical protein [Bacteroidales bacterium]
MSKKRKFKQYRLIFTCLVLSILAWFTLKMSQNYKQTYQFAVEFTNLPKDKFLTYRSDIIMTVSMETKGISLLKFEFNKKKILLDYPRIIKAEQQQNNNIAIDKKQLESYLINQLNFPVTSTVIEPLSISLEFEGFPDK